MQLTDLVLVVQPFLFPTLVDVFFDESFFDQPFERAISVCLEQNLNI